MKIENESLNKIIEDYGNVAVNERNLLNIRNKNNELINHISKTKQEIQTSIDQLYSITNDIEYNREKIKALREMIEDFTKNYTKPKADCNGITGYELYGFGTGLNIEYYQDRLMQKLVYKSVEP